MKDLAKIIRVARGLVPSDLVLKNARIVNVFSAEVYKGNIAIWGGRIAGIGDYQGKKEIDLEGGYVIPGLIDGHMHVESTMVTVQEFARSVVPRGTTSVICDPHEISTSCCHHACPPRSSKRAERISADSISILFSGRNGFSVWAR